MRKIDLTNTPHPHYVRAGELTNSGSILSFRGKVLFPSGDITLEDRGHVNVSHQMFAVWNVAHLAVREGLLYPNMRVLSQSGNYFVEVPIDTEVDLSTEVEILSKGKTRMKGTVSVTFRNGDGKILSTSLLVLVATK